MKTVCIVLLLVFLFFLPTSLVRAVPLAEYNKVAVQQQVLSGIDSMYSMQFDKANAIFTVLIEQHPNDPAGYFFRSTIYLWQYIFDKSDADLTAFIAESDRVIDKAEQTLEDNPDDPDARTYLGATYGYRAMANLQAKNYLKASWDVRNCYAHLSEAIKKNPQQYEAYLGMGIFNFLIGALPKTSQTLMNLVGITGNKELGIQQLRIAAEKARYTRNDARFALGLLYVYYKGEYDKGLGYLKPLLQRYPNNIPLLYALGNIEAQLKKMPTAIAYYKKVLSLSDTHFQQFTVYSNYRLGEALFRSNDFENSKRAMQKFIKSNTDQPYKATALFRLAESYELLGNRQFAVQLYQRIQQCMPVTPEDVYAVRKAKYYVQEPLSDNEKQLIRGVNCVESRQFEEGVRLLQPLTQATTATSEQQAEALYHIGEILRQQQNYTKALEAYQKVILLAPDQERWLLPWSYFRMSQVYYAQKSTERSRATLEKAQVFSDYDFQEWLVFLIERDISTLY